MKIVNIQKFSSYQAWLILLLTLLIISIILLAGVPPYSRDALIHHLQIPKLYLRHGGMYEIPELPYSYYPMYLQLLYMGALYFGSDIAAKYIHMFFGLVTAFLIYRHLHNRLSRNYALLGSLFFLSIPIIVQLSITAYVDLGLTFFSTGSLLLIFKWIESDYKNRHLILAGVFSGLAAGTKYNALLCVFLFTLFIPILYHRNQKHPQSTTSLAAVQPTILFILFAILAFSPLMIRNAAWTGNPIYPLFDTFFNPAVSGSTSGNNFSPSGGFSQRQLLYQETPFQLLMLPIRIFFEGSDGDPRYFDGRLNPFLLFLPFLFLYGRPTFTRRIQLEQATLLIFSILYLLLSINMNVIRIRYLAPIVPFLVILSMYGLHSFNMIIKRHIHHNIFSRLIFALPVCIMIFLNTKYIYEQFQSIKPIKFISGQVNRDDFLQEKIAEYSVVLYANNNLPASANILCIFMGNRGYYLDIKHIFEQSIGSKYLLKWLTEPSMSSDTIATKIKELNISHIILRNDLMHTWLSQTPDVQLETWQILLRDHLFPLFSHNSYTLYKFTPENI